MDWADPGGVSGPVEDPPRLVHFRRRHAGEAAAV